MKLAKDDLVAALRLRYDHYSALSMFDAVLARAALADAPAYDAAQIAAFRGALGRVGDRVGAVDAWLGQWLERAQGGEKPAEKAPEKPPQKAPEKAVDKPADKAPAAAPAAAVDTVVAVGGVETKEGEVVMMCGSGALGDWDPARARPMTRAGDRWVATLALVPGEEAAFKFLRRSADGNIVWEKGDDRKLVAAGAIDATWR